MPAAWSTGRISLVPAHRECGKSTPARCAQTCFIERQGSPPMMDNLGGSLLSRETRRAKANS